MRDQFDVAIAGAGPVACAAALSLAKRGMRVALSGAGLVQTPVVSERIDTRVYALAPDACEFLASVDVYVQPNKCSSSEAVAPNNLPRANAYQAMRVWEAGGSAIEFAARDYGWDALGTIVEHRSLQAALQTRVENTRGIRMFFSDATRCVQNAAGIELQLEDQSLNAKLVLDATGANSPLRDALGIANSVEDYQQRAVVALISCVEKSSVSTAWQVFSQGSVVALLPLCADVYVLVYSAPSAHAQALMDLSDSDCLAKLQALFAEAPVELTGVSERSSVPLKRMLAAEYTRERFALLGDAAHTVHPLAGQGLNMGMRDVSCLSKVLSIDALANAASLSGALASYGHERKSENTITALGIEALQKLYAPESGPLKLLRTLGLQGVASVAPLKRLFAELATGKIAF
jgi:2-polyprenylphenol 6-hydroxylase